MPKTKAQKKEILKELDEKIKKSKSVAFVSFNGLTVKETSVLRKELRTANGEYYVAKKTLVDLAFKDSGIADLNVRELEGQMATIFSFVDEVAPIKIIDLFKKDKEGKIEFLGGILENKFLNQVQMSALAKLPGKQELYAQIVGSLNAPISGFVNALAGNLKNLVYVLKAIETSKQ
jgi:large subunit ribosomal protein L10